MAEGRSNIAIAARLQLSPKTLEAHIRRILQRLGLEESPTITVACSPSWSIWMRHADPAASPAGDERKPDPTVESVLLTRSCSATDPLHAALGRPNGT